jgi:hypothetical protein
MTRQSTRAFSVLHGALNQAPWIPATVALAGGALAGWFVVSPHEWLARHEAGWEYTSSLWICGAGLAWLAMLAARVNGITSWLKALGLILVASAVIVLVLSPIAAANEFTDTGVVPFQTTTFDQGVAFVSEIIIMIWGVLIGFVAGPLPDRSSP